MVDVDAQRHRWVLAPFASSAAHRSPENAGVDYDDVVETLEREGVEKFSDSFDELLEGIQTSRRELVTA